MLTTLTKQVGSVRTLTCCNVLLSVHDNVPRVHFFPRLIPFIVCGVGPQVPYCHRSRECCFIVVISSLVVPRILSRGPLDVLAVVDAIDCTWLYLSTFISRNVFDPFWWIDRPLVLGCSTCRSPIVCRIHTRESPTSSADTLLDLLSEHSFDTH